MEQNANMDIQIPPTDGVQVEANAKNTPLVDFASNRSTIHGFDTSLEKPSYQRDNTMQFGDQDRIGGTVYEPHKRTS